MSPTPFDPTSHLLVTPEDSDVQARITRLKELGLGEVPVPEYDDFARELAMTTGAPFAMVNFIGEERMYFAGLYHPGVDQTVELDPSGGGAAGAEAVSRFMPRDHGYCPHVVARRKALVLDDVCDYPRFAGNPVVDEIGIRSYMGAPLIDRTGTPLGTVCVVDREARPWGRQGLETIKARAAEMVERIHRREREGS